MGNLASAVLNYINNLKLLSQECTNLGSDGEKCVQCRERLKVVDELERILLRNSLVTQKDIDQTAELSGVR
jgi:hypothetical protein